MAVRPLGIQICLAPFVGSSAAFGNQIEIRRKPADWPARAASHRNLLEENLMRALELKKVVTAGPKEYDIAENGTAIGEVDIDGKSSGDHATIKLADKVYRATLDGGQLRCTLSVEADGERVATAEKAGALKASFNVKVGGKAYVFTKSGLFGRKIALTEGGKEVGSMKGSVLNLPDDLPVDGQALIIWIFVVMEKWDSDNNAGL